jgi:hypothetical protein
MRICPTCGAFYADDTSAFCLVEGMPLISVDANSDKWRAGQRVLEEKASGLKQQQRRLKWRRILITALILLIATRVVYVLMVDGWVYLEREPPPPPLQSSLSFPSPSPSPPQSPTPSPSVLPASAAYQISGRVTLAGKALGKVKITLGGSKSVTTTTDAFGKYRFVDLAAGGPYTITPIAENIKFTARSINKLTKDETVDFVGLPQLFKISGHVESKSKTVTIMLGGAKSATTKTDKGGKYSFNDLPAGGPYTVTPTADNLKFTARSISKLTKDETVDFVALPQLFKISGHVTSNGRVIDVMLRGPKSGKTTTESSGRYSFSNLPAGGPYTITPSGPTVNFTPQTINNLAKDELINFDRVQHEPTPTGECSREDRIREEAIIAKDADRLFKPGIEKELAPKLAATGISSKPLLELGRVDSTLNRSCTRADAKVGYTWSINAKGLVKAKMAGMKTFVCNKTGPTWRCS